MPELAPPMSYESEVLAAAPPRSRIPFYMLGVIAIMLLTGRLIALDSQPVAGVRVIIRWNEQSVLGPADTLSPDSMGRFGTLVGEGADSVAIVIDPLPGSPFDAARIVVARERLSEEVRILLIPKRWTIRGGLFAGAEVPVDPAAALRRAPDYGSFGRLRATRIVGWMPGSYPIPIVLGRDGARISGADSVAFWDAAHDVEAALGARFFEPWSDTTMRGRIYPVDVRLDRSIPGAGITFISWDGDGNIFEGSVRFRGSREMRIAPVVQHELMHVLGFGHTAAWPSAMETRSVGARGLTREDVAYAQLLIAAHQWQTDRLVVGGLVESGRGADTLPPRHVSSHFPPHDITAPLASRERHPRLGNSSDRR